MYLRRWYQQTKEGRRAYWALVESRRTERGPRQHVVAYLGEMEEGGRIGLQEGDEKGVHHENHQKPEYVEVDIGGIRVIGDWGFGGPWLGLEMARRLGLIDFLEEVLPSGREVVPWSGMSLVLVLSRFCDPSSELHIAENSYEYSGLEQLLGIPASRVNEDRLYRALDILLPHKQALEKLLCDQLGRLFQIEYDLLLYDITSTYFEGQVEGNPDAQRGYSRDHRPDCKQVCIGLVVTREGLPLGYEIFAGNTHDSMTLKEIVTTMEDRYGRANRIWAMDRGLFSEKNILFLRQSGRRYILGTPKSMLKQFRRELESADWNQVHPGLEVRQCKSLDGVETFILCRSRQRREKEKAMHDRFEKRIEDGLKKMAASCGKRRIKSEVLERRIGRLLCQNSRAAGLYQVQVTKGVDGFVTISWSKDKTWRDWADLSEGCYILRTNVNDWSAEDLWHAYIQLTDAEAAFRIHKNDLRIRPVWHQKRERVHAHIFVCFLAYVLFKTLGQFCKLAGLGNEPRAVLHEIQQIRLVEVTLPTRSGLVLNRRYVSTPSPHQKILLQHLGLSIPPSIP